MNYKELRRIARRNGIVRWTKSGIFEQLFMKPDSGMVFAKRVWDGSKEHGIRAPNGMLETFDFLCVEFSPEAPVSIGELMR